MKTRFGSSSHSSPRSAPPKSSKGAHSAKSKSKAKGSGAHSAKSKPAAKGSGATGAHSAKSQPSAKKSGAHSATSKSHRANAPGAGVAGSAKSKSNATGSGAPSVRSKSKASAEAYDPSAFNRDASPASQDSPPSSPVHLLDSSKRRRDDFPPSADPSSSDSSSVGSFSLQSSPTSSPRKRSRIGLPVRGSKRAPSLSPPPGDLDSQLSRKRARTGGSSDTAALSSKSVPRDGQHYIVRIATALQEYPEHHEHMSLFRNWSNAAKEDMVKDFRKSSDQASPAAGSLRDVLFERSQKHTAFAFDIIVDYLPAHTDRAKSHGSSLSLGGRYAGRKYVPSRCHSSTMEVHREKIAKLWGQVLPFLQDPRNEVPYSRLQPLLEEISLYFAERMQFAHADFHKHHDLHCIAKKAKQQYKQVGNLLHNYQSYLAQGLSSQQLTVHAVHRCWFDLLFEFCKEYGGVPEASLRRVSQQAPPRFLSSLPSSSFQIQSQQQHPFPPGHQHPPQAQLAPSRLQQLQQPPPHQAQQQQQQQQLQLVPYRPQRLQGSFASPQPLFVGKPVSADIVGSRLATFHSPSRPCRKCQGAHWTFECPQAYFLLFGASCPGFDSQGTRVPAAWANGEITDQTKAAWRAYIPRFRVPVAAEGPTAGAREVDFS